MRQQAKEGKRGAMFSMNPPESRWPSVFFPICSDLACSAFFQGQQVSRGPCRLPTCQKVEGGHSKDREWKQDAAQRVCGPIRDVTDSKHGWGGRGWDGKPARFLTASHPGKTHTLIHMCSSRNTYADATCTTPNRCAPAWIQQCRAIIDKQKPHAAPTII